MSLLVLSGAIILAITVWLTIHRYHWAQPPEAAPAARDPAPIRLLSDEAAKLIADAAWNPGRNELLVDLHNGSSWEVNELSLAVAIYEGSKSSWLWARVVPVKRLRIEPLSNGKLSIQNVDEQNQELKGAISCVVSDAKGRKP